MVRAFTTGTALLGALSITAQLAIGCGDSFSEPGVGTPTGGAASGGGGAGGSASGGEGGAQPACTPGVGGAGVAPSEPLWARRFGDSAAQQGYAVAVDPTDGAVVIAGDFRGAIELPGIEALTSTWWGPHAFVIKLDSCGTPLWARAFGADNNDCTAHSLTIGDAGEIYVAGTFGGSLSLGENVHVSAGGADGYLVALDADGEPDWSLAFGGAEADEIWDLERRPDGSQLILGGAFRGTATVGGTPLVSQADADALVVLVDPADGTVLDATSFGGQGYQGAVAVAMDDAGGVLVGVNFAGTVSFGSTGLVAAGATDLAIARFQDETLSWQRSFGGPGPLDFESLSDLDFGPSGAVLLSGWVAGEVSFGTLSLTTNGYDAFVAELDAEGDANWVTPLTGEGTDGSAGLAVVGSGGVVVTGQCGQYVDVAPLGPPTACMAGDPILVRLDGSGAGEWAATLYGPGVDTGAQVAVDPLGGVVVVGIMRESLFVGSEELVSLGAEDVFVARFAL